MFDELERLGEDEHLFALLAHYAGAADGEAWQDRVMALDGARPEDLVRLHGELLAYEWIELNTAPVLTPPPGTVPRCYRATAAGLKALRQGRPEGRAAA